MSGGEPQITTITKTDRPSATSPRALKRKWMGIEPTRHALTHLNGFEDRDDHQIAITSGYTGNAMNASFRNAFSIAQPATEIVKFFLFEVFVPYPPIGSPSPR